MYEFGVDLGISFQLKDDYLDTFGDAEKFGKKIGGDILANKKTYLYLKALEKAGGQQKEELIRWYTEPGSDPDAKIREVIRIFKALEVDADILDRADHYSGQATAILDSLPVDKKRKEPLESLARLLLGREH
jgi:geranylgeranyl diphosphate synthase type II